jgi:hypothetical protein
MSSASAAAPAAAASSSASQTPAAAAAAAPAAASGTKPAVQPSEVGWLFVPQYYTFLNQNPGRLHCFYTKKSTLVHGTELEDTQPCFGQQVRAAGAWAADRAGEERDDVTGWEARRCCLVQRQRRGAAARPVRPTTPGALSE